ncbi:mitochondrial carrier homolog 2 [Halyomorpha halys]|uniref:mitochondrial carrier homolog 2 n=1 Tax=Halyomorpha halys TaxID=286706 RepID=UPI0034D1F225
MSDQESFPYHDYAASMGFQVLFTVVIHPIEFAEFLMQIGHTPIPGYPMRTFLGLRNVFKYIGHIRSKEGCLGCYRGLLSRIRTRIVGASALAAFTYNVRVFEPSQDEEELSFSRFLTSLWKELVEVSVTIIASQPFIVISWRVMGQFVGHEKIYSSFFWTIGEIYSRSGVTGFFTGLVPRWLCDTLTQAATLSICYVINCYLISDPLHRAVTRVAVRYLCYLFTNPLTVAAVCFGVNDCGLACGVPPNMPIFRGWTDALAYITRPRKASIE